MSSSMIDENKPRIFVSSVMEGFDIYRQSARIAIEAVEADPILIEDYPSLSRSPRNACLDGVQSCDAFTLIIGDRGGFIAPSGKLVVEEELEQAEASGLPVLVFIQECQRDQYAEDLISRISDYTTGYFRKTFTSPESLETEVTNALQTMDLTRGNVSMNYIDEVFMDMPKLGDQCSIRLIFASSRNEQVIDPVDLDSTTLKNHLMEIAHRVDVALFSYEVAKSSAVDVDSIIIVQEDDRRAERFDSARLELFSNGTIVLDANVTNRFPSTQPYSAQSYYEIVEEDIQGRLQAFFAFCKVFWDQTDPFMRNQYFRYNAALNNIGNRKIVDDRNTRTSFTMGFGEQEAVVAFAEMRNCNRGGLVQPSVHIDAILTMLRRQLNSGH